MKRVTGLLAVVALAAGGCPQNSPDLQSIFSKPFNPQLPQIAEQPAVKTSFTPGLYTGDISYANSSTVSGKGSGYTSGSAAETLIVQNDGVLVDGESGITYHVGAIWEKRIGDEVQQTIIKSIILSDTTVVVYTYAISRDPNLVIAGDIQTTYRFLAFSKQFQESYSGRLIGQAPAYQNADTTVEVSGSGTLSP